MKGCIHPLVLPNAPIILHTKKQVLNPFTRKLSIYVMTLTILVMVLTRGLARLNSLRLEYKEGSLEVANQGLFGPHMVYAVKIRISPQLILFPPRPIRFFY